MEHLKHVPLVLFVATVGHGLLRGYSMTEAFVCLVLAAMVALEKFQVSTKKQQETNVRLEDLVKQMDSLEKSQKETQNALSTIRTSINFKGGKV